ncbi:MAG: S8 family peptidase [Lachnospiraceae bacterium]|nr:S8 family peptidase [Lachnospiraceae bacterium]
MKKTLLLLSAFGLCIFAMLIFINDNPDENSILYYDEPITLLADLSELGKGLPLIARDEKPLKINRGKLHELPRLVYYSHFEIDLRSYDISGFDLTQYEAELEYAVFDKETKWPQSLPESFNPALIMELGKDPGLGIKSLHQQGITGKGISIAIIDEPLLTNHNEIKDNLRLYELLHNQAASSFHGTMVASLAAGRTVGVAPDANIYFIASTPGEILLLDGELKEAKKDLSYYAEAVERVLEINECLPENEKIKAVSISLGFDLKDKGADKFHEVIELAKEAGIFVITVSPEHNHDFILLGLGRSFNNDPDDFVSYDMALMWKDFFIADDNHNFISGENILYVPIDSRTFAACTGDDDYMFSAMGGNSLAVPWLAGLYALCLQVNPELTADEFVKLALETSKNTIIKEGNREFLLQGVTNPGAIVEKLLN